MHNTENLLIDIMKRHNIELVEAKESRNVIDVLEDIYLKLSAEEFKVLVKEISQAETEHGHIFDLARNRPYK
jgi:hypothetical protein